MVTVSVVVPAYNKEAYLGKCIDSILCQTMQDFEIIIVDDGSTDQTGKLAEEFARRDSRIRVIHQQNSGLGPARNTGISNAGGTYISFVDADDWIERDMIESAYSLAVSQTADICFFGMKWVNGGRVIDERFQPITNRLLSDSERQEMVMGFFGRKKNECKAGAWLVSACLGLYRRAFLLKEDVRFINILSEDRFFEIEACGKARRVFAANKAWYCYRKDGQDAISSTVGKGTAERYAQVLYELMRRVSLSPAELQEERLARVRLSIVSYMRNYLYLVEASPMRACEKRALLQSMLAYDDLLKQVEFCSNNELSSIDVIFSKLLAGRRVNELLLMAFLRRKLKQRVRRCRREGLYA